MLEQTDRVHLSFATGWLELGNPKEAHAELNQISKKERNSREVLSLEWDLLVADKNWREAHRVARALWQNWPEECVHWLHHAYALRRVPEGGLNKAWDTLIVASEKFPDQPVIAYNLACYACQLELTDKARAWIFRALELGPAKEIKQMALKDLDLEPLWKEIKRL